MTTITLNDELTLTCPDGFTVLDAAEAQRMLQLPAERLWAARDAARHIVLAVQWHDSGHRVLAKMFTAKDQIKRIDKAKRKGARQSGYASEAPVPLEIAGVQAWELDYVYQVEGIEHVGATVVFKQGSCFYTASLFAHKEGAEEARQAFKELVASLTLS